MIQCPVCQTGNPPGARFCSNCGNMLGPTCPNCGAEVAANARFCHQCGHPLAAPAHRSQDEVRSRMPAGLAAMLEDARAQRSTVGERRIVTILFCDVKGSTTLAEQLDPEEWTEIMNRAFEYLISPIFHYEGTLARLMGDAILAFFGAPITHEDDPRRAVLAGLEILEGIKTFRSEIVRRYGQDFDVRVGINTGLAVVGEVGSDLRVEYTAMGDAVNLAARMEQTARPGTVQITQHTHRLVESLFEFEPLGPIEVKGKTEPVIAYRVLRPRPGAIPERGIEGLHSPLVGRTREFQALRSAVDELLTGRGQIVSVIGEAGLGKSRLVAELRESLGTLIQDARATPRPALQLAGGGSSGVDRESGLPDTPPDTPRLQWYEGRSFSYEMARPFTPFVRLLTACLGLNAGETGAEVYARIRSAVEQLMPERVEETAPLLGTLLGVEAPFDAAQALERLEPQERQERLFQATSELIERLAARDPRGGVVLVFEDLHWADPSSVALLEHLLPLTDRLPLMMLAVFRLDQEGPARRFHESAARDFSHRYTPVALEPLDETLSRELVANLLQIEGLTEPARALILRKAEGNPFFIEEVIRSLLDARLIVRANGRWRVTRDVADIAVPDTLAGVITARLDQLDDGTRHVAQAAAVIGREFSLAALSDIVDEKPVLESALTTLQRRGLVRQTGGAPDRRYSFKHVLTQETAYGSILLSRRRDFHRRVAESLERHSVEADDRYLADLAHHFYQAGIWDRARDYAVRLGARAQSVHAPSSAIEHFTRALDASARLPDAPIIDLYRARAQAYETVGEFECAQSDYEQALQAARAKGDRLSEWQSLIDFGFLWLGRDHARAGEYFQQALALARDLDDPTALARSLNRVGNWFVSRADPLEARRYHLEALAIFESAQDRAGIAETLDLLGIASIVGSDAAQALEYYRRAIPLFRELDNRRGLSSGLAMFISADASYVGEVLAPALVEWSEALRSVEESLRIARAMGWRAGEAFSLFMVAAAVGPRGEYQRALEAASMSLEIAESIGHRPWITAARCVIGLIFLDLLEFPTARLHLEQAVAVARELNSRHWENSAAGFLGAVMVQEGRLDEAHTLLDPLLGPSAAVQSNGERRAWYARAQWALACGRPEVALEIADQLIQALPGWTPGRVLADLEYVRGQALQQLGRTTEAETALRLARDAALTREVRALLWRVQAELAKLYRSARRVDEAEQALASARAVVQEISATIADPTLRERFQAAALSRLE